MNNRLPHSTHPAHRAARGLLVGLIALLLLAGLGQRPLQAQDGAIRCTTTTALSLIPTGQSVSFSAEPRATEDGTTLFFWSTGDLEGSGRNSDGNIELFRFQPVFNADGTVSRVFRQITFSTGSILGGFNLAPDVSANGRYVTFFSDRHYPNSGFDNRDGNFEIFVADLTDINNVQIRQITNTTQGSNLYPSISSDGMRIAFISDNGLDPATAGSVAEEERNLDVYLVDLASGAPVFRQITNTRLGVLNEAPVLSGDGSSLVFASTLSFVNPADGAQINPEGNPEIFRFVLASGLLQAVTQTAGGSNEMPVVNKDGTRIAFVSDQRLDPAVNIVGQRQIFVYPKPATGSGFLQISDTVGADNFNPSISSDGNRIIYQRLDASGQRVVLYDIVAQSRQVFRSRTNPTNGEVGQPILSGNGAVLFFEDEGGISAVECSISDLALDAALLSPAVVAGEQQTLVWTVSNRDTAIASGVQVQTTFPTSFTLPFGVPDAACRVNGQTLACSFARLVAGESRTVTTTVQVGADVVGNQTLSVRAFSDTSVDRNPSNNDRILTSQVVAQADMGVVKSAFPDTALQNEAITYTLVVSNTGPSLARTVRLTDTLPPGLAFVSSPTCAATGSQVRCALGDLQPNSQVSVTVQTRVTAFLEADIVNVAVVASDVTSDPAPLNNSVRITNSVNTQFDLSVTHTVAPNPLLAGAPLLYTYLITNAGPSLADSVQLSATLPAELTAVGAPQIAAPGSCSTGLQFVCDLGTLDRNQTVVVTVSGLLTPTQTGSILSAVQVRSLTEANADKTAANDSHTLLAPVNQQTDLVATKNVSSASVLAGTLFTYTLGVQNLGPSIAAPVTISDTLPPGLTLAGLATSRGACTGTTLISCLISGLLPGEQTAVTVTVRASASSLGVLTNTVHVRSVIADPNPANNNASVPVTIQDEASLTLVKSVGVASAVAGQDSLAYTLQVGNAGPSLARSVLLTDTLPGGVAFISSAPPAGGSCTHAAGIVTCQLDNISPGITETVRINAALLPGAVGLLTNTASVSTSASDPAGPNTASAATTVNQLADLQVTKRAILDNLNVGGTVTYTVNVDNFGPSQASGVVVSDLLPIGLLSPGVTVSQGSYSQTSGLWTVGNVAAGQKLTMTVAASLGAAASGQVITNTALIHAADQPDPTIPNNGQFVTFTVPLNADVAIGLGASNATPAVQSLVTLTLSAINNGPEAATGVQVQSPLPPQLTFVSQVAGSGLYSPSTGVWNVGTLGSGTSQLLTLTARVTGSGSFTSTAAISAAEYDDKPNNNLAAVGFVVGAAADLHLSQTVSSLTPNVGDTLFFTVTVSNDGPNAAANIQVRGLLSAGMNDSFVTPAPGTTYSNTTGLWDIPLLAAGQSRSLVISKTVMVSGVQSNQAEILASSLFDPDSTPGNGVGNGEDDQASLTVTMPPAADLAVNLTASGGQFVGQDVLLQLQVTNNGPDAATNIVLTETLPAHLSYVTHLVVGSGTFDPPTSRWTIPSLAVGASTILNLTGRVGAGAAGQVISDTVDGLAVDQYDWKPGNNAPVVAFLVGGADLAVVKQVERTTADVGAVVSYTIVVANSGPTAATNVRVTDTLPISLTNIVSSVSAGFFGPSTPGVAGVWTLPSLAVGASETLTLTGVVIPGAANQIITNTISGASSNVADGNSANNTPSVGFRVTAADLALQKSSTVTQPNEGQAFFYFLNVTNSGPDVATNVVVTDTIAQGITVTVAGAGYNTATGRWDVGTLNPGQSQSLLLTVLPIVGSSGGRVIVDPIDAASASQEDPTPVINASTTITVVGADLAVGKSVNITRPTEGDTIVYSVVVTNTGPFSTTNVTITDIQPSGVTFGSFIASGGGSYNSGTGLWNIGTLDNGDQATLTITATVNAVSTGNVVITNTALLGNHSNPDRNANGGSNSASVQIVVNDTPFATSDTATTAEDTDLTIPLTGTDSDGNVLTAKITTLPALGALYQTADGTTRGAQITTVPTVVTDSSRRVIFAPLADGNGNPYTTLGFKVNDGSVDSASTGTITVNVTAVNDAPVLTVGSIAFTTITEKDTNNGGHLVSSLVGTTITDVDSGAVEGIAVTAASVTGTGTWQYSTDSGGSWAAVGTVSGSSGLLLRSNDKLRFVPDGLNGATGSVTYRAWDQTGATAGQQGTKVDVSTNGGTTAFSSGSDSASITVTAVNDAPVLTVGSTAFTTITEKDTNNSGHLVSSLVGTTITDVDSGAVEGIAVTAASVTGTGTWQYSTDSGGSWAAVGTVSGSSGLLLRSNDKLRFVPDGLNGATGSVTYRAWDQTGATAGQQGTKVDVSTNGGTTAFSSGSDSASITVTAVNDAPVLTVGSTAFTTITEKDTNNGGNLISSLVGTTITDVDSGAVEGIAVTAASVTGTGAWQYSTDSGGSWADVGTVSGSSGLLLRSNDKLRFVPDGLNGATGSVTYRAWDQTGATAGQQGTKVDVSTNGGTTAFSSGSDSASITVTAVNDAPVAVDDSVSTKQDHATSISVLDNDTDYNNDALTVSAVGVPSSGTVDIVTGITYTLAYTPNVGVIGTDSFTYTISDGALTATARVTVTIQEAPDLVVTTSDGQVSTINNGQLLYTIRYTNTGSVATGEIAITETVPLNALFVSTASTPSSAWGSCNNNEPSGSTCVITQTSLSVGASSVVTFAVQVQGTPSSGTLIANTVLIGDDGINGAEVSYANNTSEDTTVVQVPDLVVTKSDANGIGVPGGLITYTLNYTNTGSQKTQGTVLTETVPNGTVFHGAGSDEWSCEDGASAGTPCARTITGDFNPTHSDSALFVVQVVDPVGADVTMITNTVRIGDNGTNGFELNTSNNIFTDTTPINASPVLTIAKSGPESVVDGSLITYSLVITNSGNQIASGLQITDALPTGSFFSSASDGGVLAGGIVSWTLPSLATNTSITRIFAVTSSVTITNSDYAVSATGGIRAVGTLSVTTAVKHLAVLAVTKTAFPNPVTVGEQITYTVRITNTGPSPATSLRLTDTMPVTVTGVTSSTVGVLSCAGSGIIQFNLATLGVNESAQLIITGTVSATALFNEQIVNRVEVSATEAAVTQSAAVTTTVATLTDLIITKSQIVSDTIVGAVITYTLHITNTGPSYAQNVYITDSLPISVAFDSVIGMTPPNLFGDETSGANTVSWMTDTLPLVSNGLITFTGKIMNVGRLINSVVITSTTTDSDPTSNSAVGAALDVGIGLVHHFVFETVGNPQTAGSTFDVTITAKDVFNNTADTFFGMVDLTTTAGSVSPATSGSFIGGTRSSQQVTVTQAGSGKTLTATRTGGTETGTSNSFTVNPGSLHHFGFAPISSPQVAGTPFDVVITAQDVNSNTVPSFTGSVNLTTTAGMIAPTLSGNFSSGTRTESVTVTRIGLNQTIIVTNTALSLETGASGTFTVTPGAPAILFFAQEPSGAVTQTQTLSPVPIVETRDQFNNPTTASTYTYLLFYKTSGCTPESIFSGYWKGVYHNGVATFSDVNPSNPINGSIAPSDTLYFRAYGPIPGNYGHQCVGGVNVTASGLMALSADAGVTAGESVDAVVGQPSRVVVTATNAGPDPITGGHLRWQIPASLADNDSVRVTMGRAEQNGIVPLANELKPEVEGPPLPPPAPDPAHRSSAADPSACVLSETEWICELNALAVGAELPVTFTYTPTVPGRYELVAMIEGDRFDPNADNDRVTVTLQATPTKDDWRFFLPFLQSQVDAERDRPRESELFLPDVGRP